MATPIAESVDTDANLVESNSAAAGPTEAAEFSAKYAEFLSSDFDPMHYARRVVSEGGKQGSNEAASPEIDQLIATLASRADSLETLMKQTILNSHEDLLRQVIGVKAVDSTLGHIEDQVREIKSYMHALRAKIRVPYEQALMYTNQSSNLQAAIKYVRSTSKFIQLVRRLVVQIPDSAFDSGKGPKPDYPLAALTLLDIEKLVGSSDLDGITVIDDAMANVVSKRRELTMHEAGSMLDTGMKRQNQSDIASGLQILFNLGTLANTVAGKVRQYTVDWAQHISGKLDPKYIQAYVREHNAKATSADGSDMIGITSVVWSTIEELIGELLVRGLELRTLERVLARKRDTLPRFDVSVSALDSKADGSNAAGVSFLDLAVERLGDRVLAFWWGTAVAALAAELEEACANSSVIRQTLTNSYPRMVQLFFPKLEHILSPKLGGVTSVARNVAVDMSSWDPDAEHRRSSFVGQPILSAQSVSYDDPGPQILWDKLLGKFESEYVSKAATRIDDAVKRCYPPPPPPGLLDAQESWKRGTSKGNKQAGLAGNASGPTELEMMTAVNIVPNRKLVAGVVRSISTELEMAKSDVKLRCAIAEAASSAVATFIEITTSKIASATVNPHVLDPLTSPAHPLTKSYVGLVNSVESLRKGLSDMCDSEFGMATVAAAATSTPPRHSRLRSLAHRSSRLSRPSSNQSSRTASMVDVTAMSTPVRSASDSGSMTVFSVLDRCLRELGTFVTEQAGVLLGIADKAIEQCIIDAELSEIKRFQQAEGTLGPLELAAQWLQTQILETLEVDCQKQVMRMVDRYLRVYLRSVCLTYPLTEEAKLRLTGEVTQFEFACSQIVAASDSAASLQASGTQQAVSPTRHRSSFTGKPKPKLSDVGASYHALRMVRPLLFLDMAELARVTANQESLDGWKSMPVPDLVDHIICRLATEQAGDHGSSAMERRLPFGILGWSKEQWVGLLFASEGIRLPSDFVMPPTKNELLQKNTAGQFPPHLVFEQSLAKLAAVSDASTSIAGPQALIQAAQQRLSL
ncbi:Conserved oligomeric Golgi complex subunit [Linderina pennispora]|nr:Conserved oligomeric Golgi complex subunit [Linderina pennispora]